MTTERKPATASYDAFIREQLKDKTHAMAYLNAALEEEEDLAVFLLALRRVIEAQDLKMSNVAKQSGLNRENLYKMLSDKGNPELKSVKALLASLGFKIQISGESA